MGLYSRNMGYNMIGFCSLLMSIFISLTSHNITHILQIKYFEHFLRDYGKVFKKSQFRFYINIKNPQIHKLVVAFKRKIEGSQFSWK